MMPGTNQELRSILDSANKENLVDKGLPGLNEDVIRRISKEKNEPAWMLQKRLAAYHLYRSMPMPKWGPSLEPLDLESLYYYLKPDAQKNARDWEDVPDDIRQTYEKLGIPKAEQNALAGVGAQYESEVVYHNLKEEWEAAGVIFLDCDEALQKHPELFKKYFMTTCVPVNLHKFSALHAAVWSGGTFIYVPKNVKLDMPLQAYFRMNAKNGGQFEHTLIIVDEGAEVQYIEGCSAPQYTTNSLHAGCVEVHVLKGARARYSSIENWSKNTYNLNTKRAVAHEDAVIEWVNGNMGSGVTMLYPTSVLLGDRSTSDYLGIAFAGPEQNQDTGSKAIHIGKNSRSTIISKSISQDGGTTTYRGQVTILPGAHGSVSNVECDALMINDSVSKTIPYMDVHNDTSEVTHEASVGRIDEDQLFYLTSKGIELEAAKKMIVNGFIEPITKELPLEYAVELNRLIELEMESTLG